jgi:hypothetical protein
VVQALPTIISVDPDHGKLNDTLEVTITGTNLGGATEVSFGSRINVISFNVDSAEQLTVNIKILYNARPGTGYVSVTTPGGTATLENSFTVEENNSNKNSSLFGCGCSNTEARISWTELAIGWGIIGLCFGGGYYLTSKSSRGRRNL